MVRCLHLVLDLLRLRERCFKLAGRQCSLITAIEKTDYNSEPTE